MAEFYRFPQWILTALVMIVAVCIALQTLAISYSFRRLPAGWARKVENGMECAVLAALFFFAALLGQVQYGLYGSFLFIGHSISLLLYLYIILSHFPLPINMPVHKSVPIVCV